MSLEKLGIEKRRVTSLGLLPWSWIFTESGSRVSLSKNDLLQARTVNDLLGMGVPNKVIETWLQTDPPWRAGADFVRWLEDWCPGLPPEEKRSCLGDDLTQNKEVQSTLLKALEMMAEHAKEQASGHVIPRSNLALALRIAVDVYSEAERSRNGHNFESAFVAGLKEAIVAIDANKRIIVQ